jgi:hypothetical protein
MIVRCASSEGVARSVEFARKYELAVSARSGGHDQAGFSTNDGGMVIDLRGLKEIRVDRTRKRVTAGGRRPGWRTLSRSRHVGNGRGFGRMSFGRPRRLTLGGGKSALTSKYGLA